MNTPSTPPIQLSSEQLQQYNRDGFIVVEDLVSANEIHALQDRLREYTHGGRSQGHIQLQIEPRVQRGELEVDHPGDSIRKIDGLVESDEVYRRLALHDNLAGIIAQILGPDLKLFRNSVLLKPPAVGSAKGMHQDSPYWPIRPMDLCSCWFAIDDATLLGHYLLASGAISGERLEQATEEHRNSGRSLARVLIDDGYLGEAAIRNAMS